MAEITTLSERFAGLWPDTAPQTLVELCETPLSELRADATTHGWTDETLTRLIDTRRDAIAATHAQAKHPLSSPSAIRSLFDSGLLRDVPGRWITYPTDANRMRVLVQTPSGEMVYSKVLSTIVPDIDYLGRKAPLPDRGMYILIYGGDPRDITGEQKTRLNSLIATGQVADVIYRVVRKGHSPILYSTQAGCGSQGTTRVDWP